jgi:hypothetical protein
MSGNIKNGTRTTMDYQQSSVLGRITNDPIIWRLKHFVCDRESLGNEFYMCHVSCPVTKTGLATNQSRQVNNSS